jgi:hypothetical protein
MAFNSRRLRTNLMMRADRSNTHATQRAMPLSHSADLICGHPPCVMQITLRTTAG